MMHELLDALWLTVRFLWPLYVTAVAIFLAVARRAYAESRLPETEVVERTPQCEPSAFEARRSDAAPAFRTGPVSTPQ